jgi:hypothetical protein
VGYRAAVPVTRPREGAGLGVVYTPREVCEPMVRRVLEALVAGKSRAEVLALRVCDPAIGEGAFLVEIVRVLAEAAGGKDARRRVAEQCIAGVDVDRAAVGAARRNVEAFVGEPVPALRERLRVADALTCTWDETFDALVGNPPYIRQESLANKHVLAQHEVYDGVADLYVYFVELAHRIARRFCLIVPNKWLTAAYGRPLRTFLARRGSVEGLVDFGGALPLFRDADAFPCIVWGTSAGAAGPIRATRADTPDVATALASCATPHPRERWRADPWHVDAPDDAARIESWQARWPRLGDVLGGRPSRGIVTGCNRAFVIDAATRAALIERDRECAAWIWPLLKGRDVRRWTPAPIERHVLLVDRGSKPPRAILDHLAQYRDALEPGSGRKPGNYRWFELQDPVVPLATSRAPRLFFQDIQTSPACCLDATGALVPDTTVWILPTADRYLLALLNSPLYGWYARRRFPPALNGAVRPKLEYVTAFPVATPQPALRARICTLVDAQLAEPDAARDAELADLIEEAYERRATPRGRAAPRTARRR